MLISGAVTTQLICPWKKQVFSGATQIICKLNKKQRIASSLAFLFCMFSVANILHTYKTVKPTKAVAQLRAEAGKLHFLYEHHQEKTGFLHNQGSNRPGKVLEFDLGPGKLLEFQNSVICPGIL